MSRVVDHIEEETIIRLGGRTDAEMRGKTKKSHKI